MAVYYNEIEPFAAQWLRNLMSDRLIPEGDVDERDIRDVSADDLREYGHIHLFAGIGGWPYALRLAGWPDDRPVWTGSCPCQPLSSAGQRKGHADERHLWPAFQRLIAEYQPPVVFGEQVASKDGREWLSGVRADLEHLGYAVGAADLPAASVGAPHIRQRLWWVADAGHGDRPARAQGRIEQPVASVSSRPTGDGGGGGSGSADSKGHALRVRHPGDDGTATNAPTGEAVEQTSPWGDCVLIPCGDGKARRVESSIFPLAHGIQPALDSVCSCQEETWQEIADHAKRTQTDAHQNVRMVRDAIRAGSGGQEKPVGMCLEFPAPTLLLDLLFGAEATCDRAADYRSGKEEGAEIIERAVRSLRRDCGIVRPSHKRQCQRQRPDKSSAALHELSFILARCVETYRARVLEAHAASNRVGLLRGAGNAICPQVAAEFICAYSETE